MADRGRLSGATDLLSQRGSGTDVPRLTLVAYHREGAQVLPLVPGKRVVVGRTAPSDLVVPDRSLSRQHARFGLLGDEVVVEDMESTNGTWLGGKAVETEALRPGDVVMLGSVRVVVQALGGQPRLGLDGHDAFLVHLVRELQRARHFTRPLALVMLRGSGKQTGLQHWAQTALEALREIDIAALYGGDTVEVLMPEVTAEEARKLVSRMRAASIEALRCGVAIFPDVGNSVDELVDGARRALHKASKEQPVVLLEGAVAAPSAPRAQGEMIADSEAMQGLLVVARRVARGSIPVLLHGETGTGKEVLAQFIHHRGPRAEASLVAVNCAAIPAQLVESTLFGHVKGAFTGADDERAGVFEAAHGGSVLLDEIGELPAAVQAALLRVLETKTVTRVGSTQETPVDVRIIAASHRDLEAMVGEGSFREDLLYRLNAVTLEIPPLRDRPKDIDALVDHFLPLANEQNGTEITSVAESARDMIRRYEWPGNVRQLRNAIERAVVVAMDDQITPADLPRQLTSAVALDDDEGVDPKRTPGLRAPGETYRACIERLDAQVLLEALEETGGNQAEAARRLEMPRRTLVHKVKVYGLTRDDYGGGP